MSTPETTHSKPADKVEGGGAHERRVRAFSMGPNGVQMGEPLQNLRGILTGVPVPIDSLQPRP